MNARFVNLATGLLGLALLAGGRAEASTASFDGIATIESCTVVRESSKYELLLERRDLAFPTFYNWDEKAVGFVVRGKDLRPIWRVMYWNGRTALPRPSWDGHLLCDGDRAFVFILETHAIALQIQAFQLTQSDFQKSWAETPPTRQAVLDAASNPPRHTSIFSDSSVSERQDTPLSFSVVREGGRTLLRLVYSNERDHSFDLEFNMRTRKFTRIEPERQDLATLTNADEPVHLTCEGSQGALSQFTLRRRELASPKQYGLPHRGALVTLERESEVQGQGNGLIWASSRQLPLEVQAGWIAGAGVVCDEPSQSLLVFELRRSEDSFYVAAHRVPAMAASVGSLPRLDATPWGWLSQFWAPNAERIFPEESRDTGPTVRGIKVSVRNGKPLIQLIHEPPESHRYDLTYDPAVRRFEKVPVGSTGPL